MFTQFVERLLDKYNFEYIKDKQKKNKRVTQSIDFGTTKSKDSMKGFSSLEKRISVRKSLDQT